MKKATNNLIVTISDDHLYMAELKNISNRVAIYLFGEDIEIATGIIKSIRSEEYQDVLSKFKQSLVKSIIIEGNTLIPK
jgi:hypothetical protein